jgi:serine/threonine protein kinase
LIFLKKENVLVDADGHVFLGDFGFSKPGDATGGVQTNAGGTMVYFAPEMIDPPRFGLAEFKHTERSDVYACGMVFLEVSSDAASCSSATNHTAGSHS